MSPALNPARGGAQGSSLTCVVPRSGSTGRRQGWLGCGVARKCVAALVAGLCAASAHAGIVLVDDAGAALTLAQPAQRIVSLLPALTESVCEVQACDRLVGTDRYSNWPAPVAALPRLGGLEDLQVERLVALRPDLVLIAGSMRALERLRTLGLPVLVLEPRTMDDVRRTLRTVAQAVGRPQEGDAAWQRMQVRIDAAAARVPEAMRGRSVYFEIASVPFAAGRASFLGELLHRLHLRNIVPAAMGPFPQLNPEFVRRERPELVMASERSIAELRSRPGWGTLPALQQGRVCGFAPAVHDTLVRPGPRLAEAADAVADCLAALARGEGSSR